MVKWSRTEIKTLNYNTKPLSCRGQMTVKHSSISMHVPSLVKSPWHLHKLLPGNENMDKSRADNSLRIWWNLPISNHNPDLHNIKAHTKYGENPLMFTQVIIQKWKIDGRKHDWRTDGWMDWHTDVQFETLICLCWNFTAQSTQWGQVERGQFT